MATSSIEPFNIESTSPLIPITNLLGELTIVPILDEFTLTPSIYIVVLGLTVASLVTTIWYHLFASIVLLLLNSVKEFVPQSFSASLSPGQNQILFVLCSLNKYHPRS